MGSFNVTCALSGLPITDGTPVRAVVLFKPTSEADHGFLYSSSFFTPASLPMRGVYSGYGGVKKLETRPLARAALAAFFDDVDSETAAEQAVDGLRFKPANASITRYGRAVDGKIHLTLIREDVFEMAATLGVDLNKRDLGRGQPLLDEKSITKDLLAIAERENDIAATDENDSNLSQILTAALKRQEPLLLKTPLSFVTQRAEGDMTAAAFNDCYEMLKSSAAQQGATAALLGEATDLATLMHIQWAIMPGLGKTWAPCMRSIGGATPWRLNEVFAREVGAIATGERRWQQAAKRAEEKGEKAPPRAGAKPR